MRSPGAPSVALTGSAPRSATSTAAAPAACARRAFCRNGQSPRRASATAPRGRAATARAVQPSPDRDDAAGGPAARRVGHRARAHADRSGPDARRPALVEEREGHGLSAHRVARRGQPGGDVVLGRPGAGRARRARPAVLAGDARERAHVDDGVGGRVGRRAAGGGRRARAAGSLTRRCRGGRRVRTAVPRSAAAPARREHRAGREEDEEQQAPHRRSMARRAAPCARTCYQPAMPQPGLAVQLYTLRDRLSEDLEGTLAALAGTGAQRGRARRPLRPRPPAYLRRASTPPG